MRCYKLAFKFEQIQNSSFLNHLENFKKYNCRQTNSGWVQLDTNSSFDICWTLAQMYFCNKLNTILLYNFSPVKIQGGKQFDSGCFRFTADFKSL